MEPQNNLSNLAPILATYGVRVLGALIGLWIAFRVAGATQNKVTHGLQTRKFDATLSVFFGSLARWLILLASILTVLSVFGIETTSFAAIIGAAGLAVGLAFQATLSNFSAGVMLLVFRPFKVGDLILANGVSGEVKEIALFTTALDTLDGRRIILPNSAVSSGLIENQTHNPHRRCDVCVNVGDISEPAIRKLLNDVGATIEGRDPQKGHDVVMNQFIPGGSQWYLRVWAKSTDYLTVLERTHAATKRALDEAKVPGPLPGHSLLHMNSN